MPDAVDTDPIRLLAQWLQTARGAGEPMPEAMALATASADAVPSARMVILRGIDRGLVWFTDSGSDKGVELAANPHAALVLHWLRPAHRQVRAVGPVEAVGADETDAYWHARPPGARRAAVASLQSQVVSGRAELEERVAEVARRFPDGSDVPRPSRWSGFRLLPVSVEFWEEAPDGLHERIRHRLRDGAWDAERLSP